MGTHHKFVVKRGTPYDFVMKWDTHHKFVTEWGLSYDFAMKVGIS